MCRGHGEGRATGLDAVVQGAGLQNVSRSQKSMATALSRSQRGMATGCIAVIKGVELQDGGRATGCSWPLETGGSGPPSGRSPPCACPS